VRQITTQGNFPQRLSSLAFAGNWSDRVLQSIYTPQPTEYPDILVLTEVGDITAELLFSKISDESGGLFAMI
jgi:hypothetical protein